PGKEKEGLQAEMRTCQEQGYKLLKMKVGGADLDTDRRRIEWVMELVASGQDLAVDANGRLSLEEALAYGRMIDDYKLTWFEEPCDPLDYMAHAVLAESIDVPIATGENLFSVPDFRNLLRHGGLRTDRDWLQPDPSLCYGLTECLRILDMAERAGWSRRRCVPHGGHQLGLNMAAGLQLGGAESYPGVFQPYGGFADDTPVADGYVVPHDTPGLGIERRAKLFADIRARLELA
ncbi:MAG: mandelate racemase, partial [Hyphomicrobiaceae bacterium]|nr:mandelate racemase [Hyphomicrobiaceae bacterium]